MSKEIDKIAKAIGLSAEEITALYDGDTLKADASATVISKYREKLEVIETDWKERVATAQKEGHAKGAGKSMADAAKVLKKELDEKAGFDFDENDISGSVLKYGEHVKAEAVKNNDISDEAAIKSKAYKELQKKINSEYVPKKVLEEKETEFNAYKNGLETKQKQDKVFEQAVAILESKKVNWGDTPEKAARSK